MPLAPDTRLGPYDIVALIGVGGMGRSRVDVVMGQAAVTSAGASGSMPADRG